MTTTPRFSRALFPAPAGLALGLILALRLAAADALTALDLREVRVGGEIGRRLEITINNNLLVIDAEKDFLTPFRRKAAKGGYIGLGKLIDATVRFAANTGDPRVLALKQHLVAETLRTQEADGYIGEMAPEHRVRGMWDIHELGYVIWALVADHQFFGEERSLTGARRSADFLLARWPSLPPDWDAGTNVAVHVAVTGIERALLALHRATGEARYLEFVTRTRALREWNLPIVVGRRPGIEGHVYAYLARCVAQLELPKTESARPLLAQSERALDFMLRHDGLHITGGTGQREIWTDDQDGRGELGETCATAYQLRLYDSLLRLGGDPRMGDLIERTVWNALFAAQSPDGRRLRYYAPTEGPRVYWKGDTYCCPCNFRRIVAELPAMVFYRAGAGVAVNLYTPAQTSLKVAGDVPLALRQETDYPNSGRIRLRLDPARSAVFPLLLRIPAWARGATCAVNGQPIAGEVRPGAFLEVNRTWAPGDEVTLELPLAWRLVKGRQRQAGRVAVMRGPQVFCLNPAGVEALARLDAADLGYVVLDPASLADAATSDAVRPGGLACRVRAWKPSMSVDRKTDLELTLTEFPDPDGRVTYFRLRDFGPAVDDELLAGKLL